LPHLALGLLSLEPGLEFYLMTMVRQRGYTPPEEQPSSDVGEGILPGSAEKTQPNFSINPVNGDLKICGDPDPFLSLQRQARLFSESPTESIQDQLDLIDILYQRYLGSSPQETLQIAWKHFQDCMELWREYQKERVSEGLPIEELDLVSILYQSYLKEADKRISELSYPQETRNDTFKHVQNFMESWQEDQRERVLKGFSIEEPEIFKYQFLNPQDSQPENKPIAFNPINQTDTVTFIGGVIASADGKNQPVWKLTGYNASYSRLGSFDEIDLERNKGQVPLGTLGKADFMPSNPPVGTLTLLVEDKRNLIPLPTDANHIMVPQNKAYSLYWDATYGQFYVKLDHDGVKPGELVFDVYENDDGQFEKPLTALHFQNNSPSLATKEQLATLTRSVFEEIKQLQNKDLFGAQALSESEALRYAAAKLQSSWLYDLNPKNIELYVNNGVDGLKYLHDPNYINTALCSVAASEFFLAARAYGYNVRYVRGYLASEPAGDASTFVMGHAWVEYQDPLSHHTTVLESTPCADVACNALSEEVAKKVRTLKENPNYLLTQITPETQGTPQTHDKSLGVDNLYDRNGRLYSLREIKDPLSEHKIPQDIIEKFEAISFNGEVPPHLYDEISFEAEGKMIPLPTEIFNGHAMSLYISKDPQNHVFWSPQLGQFFLVRSTAAREKVTLHFYRKWSGDRTEWPILQIFDRCKLNASGLPPPSEVTPSSSLPEDIQKLFERIKKYQDPMYGSTAFSDGAALDYAKKQIEEMSHSSWASFSLFPLAMEKLKTLFPDNKMELPDDKARMMLLFLAAQSYGYDVQLIVGSSQETKGNRLWLQLNSKQGTKEMWTPWTPYNPTDENKNFEGYKARAGMMDRWDSFKAAQDADQEIENLTKLSSSGKERKSRIDQLTKVYEELVRLPETALLRQDEETVGVYGTGQSYFPLYKTILNDPTPSQVDPHFKLQLPALQSTPQAYLGHYNLNNNSLKIDGIDGEIQIYDPVHSDYGQPIVNAAGQEISIRDLKSASFVLVKTSNTYWKNKYYFSRELGLVVSVHFFGSTIFRDDDGSPVKLSWKYEATKYQETEYVEDWPVENKVISVRQDYIMPTGGGQSHS